MLEQQRMAPDISKWEVLVVEDDEDNLTIAAQILTFYGAKVHTATDGFEGLKLLERLEQSRLTCVLLDLSMPKMDGWEMLDRIRSKRQGRVPVIALTAHAMHGYKDQAMQAGFDGYITKPIDLSTFIDEIKQCLNGQKK